MKTAFARKRRGMRTRAVENCDGRTLEPVHGNSALPIHELQPRVDNDLDCREAANAVVGRMRECAVMRGELSERASSLSES